MKFELRTLNATDIFPMSTIISKVGIEEFKKCFESDEIKELAKGGKGKERLIGMSVMFQIGNVILSNLHRCENDLYSFIASVANVKIEDVKNLSMGEFVEVIVEIVKKPEFKDFFSAVSRLFKSEK